MPPLGTRARGPACRPVARVRRSGLHMPGSDRRRRRRRRRRRPRDPDADQIAAEVMPLRQAMQGLASEELLADLALERDAVGSMLSCHGPSSENPAPRSIPQLPTCPAPGAHSTRWQKSLRSGEGVALERQLDVWINCQPGLLLHTGAHRRSISRFDRDIAVFCPPTSRP